MNNNNNKKNSPMRSKIELQKNELLQWTSLDPLFGSRKSFVLFFQPLPTQKLLACLLAHTLETAKNHCTSRDQAKEFKEREKRIKKKKSSCTFADLRCCWSLVKKIKMTGALSSYVMSSLLDRTGAAFLAAPRRALH